ncbi:MAG: thymidine kinase [Culicoidibacterales bacterium]
MYFDLRKEGWLEVICGSMFAGKTEELIRRLKRLEYAKKTFYVFKPQIDNRYSDTDVVSHNGQAIQAIAINSPQEALDFLTPDTAVVAFDEVQFFDESVIEVIELIAAKGIRVIAAGLDMDFRGEPFGVIPKLLAKAEFVTKLTAICTVCGEPATRTQRLIDGQPANYHDPIVLVGAKESYEARCRHCHQVQKDYRNQIKEN